MKTLFAKSQTNDKQLNHKSGEIKNGARQFQSEMKKPENAENKPGIFTRFVNWVKSIFSKKTEPNLESGATSEGKSTSWENLHDKAKGLTAEQVINDVPEEEYKSLIKPGIYETAMNDLGDLLAKRQAKLADLEKRYEKTTNDIARMQKLQDENNERIYAVVEPMIREMIQLSGQMAKNSGAEVPDYSTIMLVITRITEMSKDKAARKTFYPSSTG